MNKHVITHEMIEEFKMHLNKEEKSDNTINKYIRDVRSLCMFVGSKDFDKNDVIDYKGRIKEDYAISSVNSMIAGINSFFSYAGWDEMKVKPIKMQRKIYNSEEKELNKEEYIRLCEAAERKNNRQLSLLMQTVCATGIRISELKYITVEAVLKGEAEVSLKGKTRIILIVEELQRKLLGYSIEMGITSGAIFTTEKGEPVNRTAVWRGMKKICEEAEVNAKKAYPHNLRHLFARTFYNAEKDISMLADILGHSDINTTRIYIMGNKKEHKKCMEKMKLTVNILGEDG